MHLTNRKCPVFCWQTPVGGAALTRSTAQIATTRETRSYEETSVFHIRGGALHRRRNGAVNIVIGPELKFKSDNSAAVDNDTEYDPVNH